MSERCMLRWYEEEEKFGGALLCSSVYTLHANMQYNTSLIPSIDYRPTEVYIYRSIIYMFPGLSRLQFLIAYCKRSKTGAGEGLGMRLV